MLKSGHVICLEYMERKASSCRSPEAIKLIFTYIHGLNYIQLHSIVYNPQANEVQFMLLAADLSGLAQYPFLLLSFEGLTPLM